MSTNSVPPVFFDIGTGGLVERPLPVYTVEPALCAAFVDLTWTVTSGQAFAGVDNAKKVLHVDTNDTQFVGPH